MSLTQKSFIFIGSSGSGKGTQAKLLQDHITKLDPSRKILYVQSGAEFREFIKGESAVQKMSNEIYQRGGLQPEFLAVYIWSTFFTKNYTTTEHLIMDGMPRKYHEAGVLHSFFESFKLKTPIVIYIDINKEESVRRLLARKRFDDTKEKIEERLSWFETDTAHTLDFYRDNPDYVYLAVNGEQSIEKVHQDILDKVTPHLTA